MEIKKEKLIGDPFEGFEPTKNKLVDYQVRYIPCQNKILVVRISHLKSIKDPFRILDSDFNTIRTLDYEVDPRAKVLVMKPTLLTTMIALYPIYNDSGLKEKVVFFNLDSESFKLREDPRMDVKLEGIQIQCGGRMNRYLPVGSQTEKEYLTSLSFFDVEAKEQVFIETKMFRGSSTRILVMSYQHDKFLVYVKMEGYRVINGFYLADLTRKSIQVVTTKSFLDLWSIDPDFGLELSSGRFVFYDSYSCGEIEFDQEEE